MLKVEGGRRDNKKLNSINTKVQMFSIVLQENLLESDQGGDKAKGRELHRCESDE